MVAQSMRRKTLGAMAALMLAVGALGLIPVGSALAYDANIKIFKSADGKVVLICHYDQKGNLLYCDVATPAN